MSSDLGTWVDRISAQVKGLTQELAELRREKAEYVQRLQESQEKTKELEKRCAAWQQRASRSGSRPAAPFPAAVAVTPELADLRATLQQRDSELGALQATVQQRESEISRLQSALAGRETEVHSLRLTTRQLEQEQARGRESGTPSPTRACGSCHEIQRQYQTQREQLQAMSSQVVALGHAAKEYQDAEAHWQARLQQEQRETQQLREAGARTAAVIEQLQKALAERDAALQAQASQAQSWAAEKRAFVQERLELQKRFDELQTHFVLQKRLLEKSPPPATVPLQSTPVSGQIEAFLDDQYDSEILSGSGQLSQSAFMSQSDLSLAAALEESEGRCEKLVKELRSQQDLISELERSLERQGLAGAVERGSDIMDTSDSQYHALQLASRLVSLQKSNHSLKAKFDELEKDYKRLQRQVEEDRRTQRVPDRNQENQAQLHRVRSRRHPGS
jgi:chromosome segregation ATPase